MTTRRCLTLMRFSDLSPLGGQKDRHLNPCAEFLIDEYVTIYSPFRQDFNHLSGVGFCQTIIGWDAVSAIQDKPALEGRMDMTGKEVHIRLRPCQLDTGTLGLSLFLQTVVHLGKVSEVSAWVSVPVYALLEYQWQTLVYKMENFRPAGNSPDFNTPEWKYEEHPFEETLDHCGTMALAFTDGDHPISGALQLDTFQIL